MTLGSNESMGLMGGVKGRMMKEVTWHVVHVTVVECRDWNQSVLMFFVKKKGGGEVIRLVRR
jgi:hypothetical protein